MELTTYSHDILFICALTRLIPFVAFLTITPLLFSFAYHHGDTRYPHVRYFVLCSLTSLYPSFALSYFYPHIETRTCCFPLLFSFPIRCM